MHHCNHCKHEITQSLVAPIVVSIRAPGETGYEGIEVHFCCWQCAAMWFNERAGEILMPDLDSDFFDPNGPSQKWSAA